MNIAIALHHTRHWPWKSISQRQPPNLGSTAGAWLQRPPNCPAAWFSSAWQL